MRSRHLGSHIYYCILSGVLMPWPLLGNSELESFMLQHISVLIYISTSPVTNKEIALHCTSVILLNVSVGESRAGDARSGARSPSTEPETFPHIHTCSFHGWVQVERGRRGEDKHPLSFLSTNIISIRKYPKSMFSVTWTFRMLKIENYPIRQCLILAETDVFNIVL